MIVWNKLLVGCPFFSILVLLLLLFYYIILRFLLVHIFSFALIIVVLFVVVTVLFSIISDMNSSQLYLLFKPALNALLEPRVYRKQSLYLHKVG